MNNPKDISIKSLLAERGVTPKTERGGVGMYCSPFRSENTPSFKVDYFRNLWYDFGIGEGGSIIDLVMRLDGLNFHQAATKLERGDFSSSNWSVPTAPTTYTPKTEIISTDIIKNRHLIAYLEKRAINLDIAKRYCREVYYLQNNKQYFAIGFKSDDGGWELRNEYYKGGTSPKAPTTIDVNSNICVVFEGFIDMLSHLTLQGGTEPINNICVLNSVTNLSKATAFLKSNHSELHCHLDNDTAGKRTLAEIEKLGIKTIDQSTHYSEHKDLNEYLMAQRKPEAPKPRMKMRR
ncbi:MAG: toprim domain-containing protein [Rikenellaceae bacterium]